MDAVNGPVLVCCLIYRLKWRTAGEVQALAGRYRTPRVGLGFKVDNSAVQTSMKKFADVLLYSLQIKAKSVCKNVI